MWLLIVSLQRLKQSFLIGTYMEIAHLLQRVHLGSELYKFLTEASYNENNVFNAMYWTSVLSGLW